MPATVINVQKNASTVANLSKHVSAVTPLVKTLINTFLLMEDGSFLLQENGDRIILEDSIAGPMSFLNLAKS